MQPQSNHAARIAGSIVPGYFFPPMQQLGARFHPTTLSEVPPGALPWEIARKLAEIEGLSFIRTYANVYNDLTESRWSLNDPLSPAGYSTASHLAAVTFLALNDKVEAAKSLLFGGPKAIVLGQYVPANELLHFFVAGGGDQTHVYATDSVYRPVGVATYQ